VAVKDRPIPLGFKWARADIPIAFIDISHVDAANAVNGMSSSRESAPISGGFERISSNEHSPRKRVRGTPSNASPPLSRQRYLAEQQQEAVMKEDEEEEEEVEEGVGDDDAKGEDEVFAVKRTRSSSLSTSTFSTPSSVGTSYYNEAEAEVIVNIINGLLNMDTAGDKEGFFRVNLSQIGVISPYNAQVRYSL
jgi:hypothetical protein